MLGSLTRGRSTARRGTVASHSKCDSGTYLVRAPSGALTFVDKRTADYLGLPKDHPLRFGIDIGAQWDAHISLLHPDDQEESRKAWSTCLRTGEAAEFSQRVRNAQGGYRWFLSRARCESGY
jgi:hypothetical protein